MNTSQVYDYNTDNNHPYINKKIAKLQQQGRTFKTVPCLIYQSKGIPVNLNCMAIAFVNEPNENIRFTIVNGKKSFQKIIACRHLAERYINTEQPKSVYLSSIDTKEKLEKHPEFLIDHNRKYNTTNVEIAYYFSLDHLSKVILDLIFDISIAKKKRDTCYLFHSYIHAMAIRIKQKEDEGVFIIYFYDPNKTNVHIKMVVSNLNNINKSTLDIMFLSKNLRCFSSFSCFTGDTPVACILSSNTIESKTEDITTFGRISPMMLYLMHLNNHINIYFMETALENPDDEKIFLIW